MSRESKKELEDLLDGAEHGLARFARENSTLRISDRRNYEKARKLENAIRKHATKKCDCANPRECLFELGKLVTKAPRPSYKAKRLAAYKR